MAGWGDLLTFAKGNADWLAPAVGAIGGALSGGRDQTTTQSSAPVLPENVKAGYDKLLGYTEQNFNRPFNARQTMRPETGGNAFQQLFQNPQMQAIQAQSDAQYAGNMPQMMASQYAAQAAAQAPAQSDTQQTVTFPQANISNYGGGDGPGNSSIAFLNTPAGQERLRYLRSRNGQVNRFNGETVNADEAMNALAAMEASGKGNALFSQAYEDYNKPFQTFSKNLNAAEYDPRVSAFGRIAPSLALAAMTAGVGAGAAGLVGPVAAGGITPTTAATGFKGLTSLATMGR